MDFKHNLISVSKSYEQFISNSFDVDSFHIFKNDMKICSGFVNDGLYFIKPTFKYLL